MSLTRKFLAALGIEADKIDEIITAHTDTVDALKNERDKYKTDAEKLPGVQAELESVKKASEEKDGKSPWKVKYDALKEEYDGYKADVAAKESKAAKSAAYRQLLKDAGVAEKRIDAVLRVSDVESIKLDKDGKIEGADKLTEGIKTEWADFIVKTSTHGAQTDNPPASTGSKTYKSKDEIYAIKDTAERQKAILDNRELFGI